MNKKDLPLFLVLLAMVILWPTIDRKLIAPRFPKPAPAARTNAPPATVTNAAGASAMTQIPGPTGAPPAMVEGAPPPAAPVEAEEEVADAEPAQTVVLSNDVLEVTFSSRGAAIESARILDYLQTPDPASGPVVLDFAGEPSLTYEGLSGLGAAHPFAVTPAADGRSIRFERQAKTGLTLVRTVTLGSNYLLKVRDEFRLASGAKVSAGPYGLLLGPMSRPPSESTVSGMHFLGADTLPPGGEKVQHWSSKLPALFKASQPPARADLELMPEGDDPDSSRNRVEWLAVKSKYFVQILLPAEYGARAVAHARRRVSPEEGTKPGVKPNRTIEAVSATLFFDPRSFEAGGDPVVHESELYLGPKKFDELNRLSHGRVEVMEFGFWKAICKFLLKVLNAIHFVIPNYGVAIILLTVLIRVLFWPITHKSTQSMKKMAEIQPLVNEIRQKYKEPQRQQREIMELYKAHKVNPVSGCLPIMIQIPVFIALFVMLRSAIELRFASFLWIRDLSEPERIFTLGVQLPMIGEACLNILPILMTVTQVWQQRLTPSAGDPMQQKMMGWMPVIMLVFFYNFASGLVLYWTTNQMLMIAQLLIQKYRREHPSVPRKA